MRFCPNCSNFLCVAKGDKDRIYFNCRICSESFDLLLEKLEERDKILYSKKYVAGTLKETLDVNHVYDPTMPTETIDCPTGNCLSS